MGSVVQTCRDVGIVALNFYLGRRGGLTDVGAQQDQRLSTGGAVNDPNVAGFAVATDAIIRARSRRGEGRQEGADGRKLGLHNFLQCLRRN
ncbi:hypothetical protein D3C72_2351120 [compost metagenome]